GLSGGVARLSTRKYSRPLNTSPRTPGARPSDPCVKSVRSAPISVPEPLKTLPLIAKDGGFDLRSSQTTRKLPPPALTWPNWNPHPVAILTTLPNSQFRADGAIGGHEAPVNLVERTRGPLICDEIPSAAVHNAAAAARVVSGRDREPDPRERLARRDQLPEDVTSRLREVAGPRYQIVARAETHAWRVALDVSTR